MSFSGLFQTQGMLFLTMLIGYIFGKKGLADDNGKSLLTDLVLFVTLPASILKSFQIEFNHQILIACMTIAIAGVVIQIGSYVLGMFLSLIHIWGQRKRNSGKSSGVDLCA